MSIPFVIVIYDKYISRERLVVTSCFVDLLDLILNVFFFMFRD